MKRYWIYTSVTYVMSLLFLGHALLAAEKDSWMYWGAITLSVATLAIYHYRRNRYIKKTK